MLLQNGADLSHRNRYGICVSHLLILDTKLIMFRSLTESMYLFSFWNLRSLPPNHDAFEDIRQDIELPPCHQLVIDGAMEQLHLNLEHNPGLVSFRDHYGLILLHWAVLCSGPEVVKVLLDAGADVNARSKSSETVLMWAMFSAQSARARVCQMLIRAGADLELEDDTGSTALYCPLCVPAPDTGAIEVLLRAGADANHVNHFGLSVLHQATYLASGSDVPRIWKRHRITFGIWSRDQCRGLGGLKTH